VQEAAEALGVHAMEEGSLDNISLFVVLIDHE